MHADYRNDQGKKLKQEFIQKRPSHCFFLKRLAA
jgi:hypothetical protein